MDDKNIEEKKIELDQSNVNINELPVDDQNVGQEPVNSDGDMPSTGEGQPAPVVDDQENNNAPANDEKKEEKEEVKPLSYKELKAEAKAMGLKFANNIGTENLLKLIEEAKKVNANVISLDNKPVSPIVLTNDKEEIPAGFVATRPNREKKNVRGSYNGRVYKEIGNGSAIWCDNGQVFNLSSIK